MSAACGSGVVQSLAPKAKRGGVLNYTKYRHIYPILVSHGLQPHSHPFFALLPPLFSYIYSLSSHMSSLLLCFDRGRSPFGGCAVLKYGKLWRSTDGRLRLTLEHVYFSQSCRCVMCSCDASSARRRSPSCPEAGTGAGTGAGCRARAARARRTSAAGLAVPGQPRWRSRWPQGASAAPAVSRVARTFGWGRSPWACAPSSAGSPCAPLAPSTQGPDSMRRSGRA